MFRIVIYAFLIVEGFRAEKYTSKYDNINLDEILESERLLKNYINCLLEKGSCTPEGTELKRNLPDALKTECSKCTEKQKENTEKIVDFLIQEKPDSWSELQSKYDPDGLYYAKKKNFIEKRMKKVKTEKAKKER